MELSRPAIVGVLRTVWNEPDGELSAEHPLPLVEDSSYYTGFGVNEGGTLIASARCVVGYCGDGHRPGSVEEIWVSRDGGGTWVNWGPVGESFMSIERVTDDDVALWEWERVDDTAGGGSSWIRWMRAGTVFPAPGAGIARPHGWEGDAPVWAVPPPPEALSDLIDWHWTQIETRLDGSTVWRASRPGERLMLLAVVDADGTARDVYGWRSADLVPRLVGMGEGRFVGYSIRDGYSPGGQATAHLPFLIDLATASVHPLRGLPSTGPYAEPWAAVPLPVPARERCGDGVAVPEPGANAALVADCATLLSLREALRPSEPLTWSAALAVRDWEGVTVSGTPARVTALSLPARGLTGQVPEELGDLSALTRLDLPGNALGGAIPAELGQLGTLQTLHLYQNRLTGEIPAELADLDALTTLFLAENAFTGCIPRLLHAAVNHDLDRLGLDSCPLPPTTLTYDTYDATGEASTPGSYAFLTEGADGAMSVVTTYEGLRDGSATRLLIHTTDAAGTSQARALASLEAGDLFEWRRADDCFVRYTVEEVMEEPAGTAPRKALDVAWMTYAFTGCSGAIPSGSSSGSAGDSGAGTGASVIWGALPHLGGPGLTAPVVHGVYQIVPVGWTGATKAREDSEWSEPYDELIHTTDITVARTMRHWREPAVPAGWTFAKAEGGGYVFQPLDGYCAWWERAPGQTGLEVCGKKGVRIWFGVGEGESENGVRYETRVVAGRPAFVAYGAGPGPSYLELRVHDPDTDVEYTLQASGLRRRDARLGRTVDQSIAELIVIAEGMFITTPFAFLTPPASGHGPLGRAAAQPGSGRLRASATRSRRGDTARSRPATSARGTASAHTVTPSHPDTPTGPTSGSRGRAPA